MGEVQGQKYMCKICSKSCVSGRSLGGHMRVHLALISASKKAAKAKAKAEIKMDCEGGDGQDGSYQLKESSKDQSNCDFQNEEKTKNCDSDTDSEDDADQNSNYELRENPKKSWRFSDPKHGLNISKTAASCKECGKEFLTLRALSGHMRSHSIKNKKKIHQCKKCGKGFVSMRAMFGHMKSHSKRSRVPADESDDSLSDLENLCPVRKKRSTVRYKSASNPYISNLNESNSAVFELGDMKEVAKSLIMLSRGVRDWSKFDSVIESSGDDDDDDDDDVYFGAESYGKSKNFVRDDGYFVCDHVVDKDKNVSEFDDRIGSCFVAEDEMKVDFGVSKAMEPEKLNEFAVKLGSKGFLVPNDRKEAISEFVKSNKASSSVQESAGSENEANNLEIFTGFEKKQEFYKSKRREHECPICFKVFYSGQALGGHKRAHSSSGFTNESNKNREVMIMPAVNDQEVVVEVNNNNDLFDLNFPVSSVDAAGGMIKRDVGLSLWWAEMGHEHEALVLTN